MTTWSSVTSIPSQFESCSALLRLIRLPALVTNTVGTRNLPASSTSFLNALGAKGSTSLPRTMTPSMSKRKPKLTSSSMAVLASSEEEDERLWMAPCFGPVVAAALIKLAKGRLAMRDMSASNGSDEYHLFFIFKCRSCHG